VNNRHGKPAKRKWLSIVKDVFPRWRDRLGSSREAVGKVKDLLRDPGTRSAKHRVNASGEEIPGTSSFVDYEFWRDTARLELVPDADGGDDHLIVAYTDSADVYWDVYSSGWHWEFYVRALDVTRWESLYPALAAPPPAPSKEPTPLVKGAAKAKPRKPKSRKLKPRKTKQPVGPPIPPELSASPSPAVGEQDVPARKPHPLTAPTSKKRTRKRPTGHDRLISLMKDLELKPGMLPHEVLRAVKQPYKDKYHNEPSQSAVTRAYDEYEAAPTTSTKTVD
jgi:hypothetical protein